MKKIFKIPTILIIIVIFLIIIGVLILRKIGTTRVLENIKNPIQNQNYQNSQIGKISYLGQSISIPKNLGIYKNTGPTLQQLAIEIALKLELTQSSFSKNAWISQDAKKILSIDTFNNYIEYSIDQNEYIAPSQKIDLALSIQNALNFLTPLNLNKNISDKPKTVESFQGVEFIPSSLENADILKVFFEQKLENLPISIDIYTFSDISVWTNKDNQVIKAIFPPRMVPTSKERDLETIDFSTAVDLIEKNKGNIIEINVPEEGRLIQKTDLGDIVLNSAVLEYRLSTKDNYFYPYYRFNGNSVIKSSNQAVSVTIILPAAIFP